MDKYDLLMNLKRQGTSTSDSNTGTATATRSASATQSAVASPSTSAAASASPTPTPTPSTSSNTPPTSSAPPTTSSTVPSTSSTVPSSTLVTTSSTVPVTSASSTPVSVSSSAPITTATSAVATSASVSAALSSTSPRTTLSVPAGTSYIRTTSGGVIFTVTAVVGQPSASASAAAKKPFFQNTGAVVGVFVVVGVVAAALAVFIITLFIRRRRAKQFDRDVQEAAREAAQAQAPIDDDDYTGGASYNTHASQPMSTERPGYGGVAAGYGAGASASSWDPYGRAGTGTTGYEMQHRRTSTGTAPGMAGFGAGDSYARAAGVDAPQGYGPGYGQQGYNNQGYQTYNNSQPPQAYALAQERGPARAPPKPQMMMPEANRQGYNTVDAYRASPSYGEAHPGEHVEYGHADNGGYGYAYSGEGQGGHRQDGARAAAQNVSPGRQSEDPYGGYEQYDAYTQESNAGDTSGALPAYASGSGNAGATGDRKGSSGLGASVGRQPSGKSANTRYSQDESEGSVDEQPQRRVLKVANQ